MTDRPLRRAELAHLDAPALTHGMTARIAGIRHGRVPPIAGGGRIAPLTDPGLRTEAR